MESNPVPAQPNQQPVPAPQEAPAAAPSTPQPEQQPTNPGGSKKMLWIVVILVVVGIVAVGGYWFMNRQSALLPQAVQPVDAGLSSLKTDLDTTTDGTESLTSDLTALDKDLSGL